MTKITPENVLASTLTPDFTEVKLSLVCAISVTAVPENFTRELHGADFFGGNTLFEA